MRRGGRRGTSERAEDTGVGLGVAPLDLGIGGALERILERDGRRPTRELAREAHDAEANVRGRAPGGLGVVDVARRLVGEIEAGLLGLNWEPPAQVEALELARQRPIGI